jgi:hypothetical protein
MCGCDLAGAAIQINAKRDLLRRHHAELPDIGADTDLLGIRRAYAALPTGFPAAGISVVVDALWGNGLRSEAERRGVTPNRCQKAQKHSARPPPRPRESRWVRFCCHHPTRLPKYLQHLVSHRYHTCCSAPRRPPSSTQTTPAREILVAHELLRAPRCARSMPPGVLARCGFASASQAAPC